MIDTIPHINIISIAGQKPTVGSEPLHAIGDDYCIYYIKNHKRQMPAAYLINETIGHFLLKAWNINTPDIAFATVPAATLTKDYGLLHKKNFYSRLAFASKEVEGAFDMTEAFTIKGKVDFKKYYQPEMLARIGLFDMWTENEDRATDLKNIMLFEKDERYHFLAIDNAMLFRTGEYGSLIHTDFTGIENNFCLQSSFFRTFKRFLKALDKNWAKREEENFYFCLQNSKQYLQKCYELLPAEWGLTEEIQVQITSFLFNATRNKQVFNEYLRLCS